MVRKMKASDRQPTKQTAQLHACPLVFHCVLIKDANFLMIGTGATAPAEDMRLNPDDNS
jgi:hypothetical protein